MRVLLATNATVEAIPMETNENPAQPPARSRCKRPNCQTHDTVPDRSLPCVFDVPEQLRINLQRISSLVVSHGV
jgi:hypothetical protein